MKQVYLIQGIDDSVAYVFEKYGHSLPIIGHSTFLPYKGYIAYDRLFGGAPCKMNKQLKRSLYEAYADAVDNNTIISDNCLSKRPLQMLTNHKQPSK
jgi:hypothetical protein